MDPRIDTWTPVDREAVIDLIVTIQRDEFQLPISAADQPDLDDVDGAYRSTGGEFWVARDDARVVGTIALIVIEPNTVVLRKLFVHPSARGSGDGVPSLAARLMETAVEWTRRSGYRTILLGTTDRMAAAHRFYAKHGFRPIPVERLPHEFPRMAVDSLFFQRDLLGVVSIRDYDPTWPALFEVERQRIESALAGTAVVVHHTGSTSVPELSAKPIIDITMTVPDSTDEASYVPALEAVGYTFHLREPEWFEHRLLHRDWPRVNLHVFSTGCDEVDRMLRFRDHLRTHAADRELYDRVKRELATREWEIVQDYADAKTSVVAEIMGRAE